VRALVTRRHELTKLIVMEKNRRTTAEAVVRPSIAAVLAVLADAYGADRAEAWLANWRVFFLACAELWGYRGGREWLVSHYLFAPRPTES